MIRETLPGCICWATAGGRVCLEAFLGTESKGAHPSPFLIPLPPPQLQTGQKLPDPDTGRDHRQNRKRRKRSQLQETKMSCHDGVGPPPSLEKAPRAPGLHPAGSVTVPSFVCSGLPSPQVQGENHGHNHPQEEHKGQPGLHKPPYAAGGKGGRLKCEKPAETKGWGNNCSNQRGTDA